MATLYRLWLQTWTSQAFRETSAREGGFVNRDCDIELVEREGEVLFGRAAGKGAEVQYVRPSAMSGVQP
jgi:hypothetical protein